MPSLSDPQVTVCVTTVSHQKDARQIAAKLIHDRMAACIQVDGPIESHYQWDGKTHSESEYRLTIKTAADRAIELREAIRAIHPYEQPEIVSWQSTDVDPGYAKWVREMTEE